MFRAAGQFPAPESVDLPLSPYARDFYKAGSPYLLRHLPFWLAAFQPLVWLIPLLVILFPLFRLLPAIYDWLERRRIYRLYTALRRLEDEMHYTAPTGAGKDFIERLDRLEDRASRLSVPSAFKPLLYGLRLHIEMVRKETQKSQTENHPTSYQCGLNVFPVSSKVFSRERIRGHPSGQAAYVQSSSAHSSCVTVTCVASVSGTSSMAARDSLAFAPIAKVY